MSTTIDSLNFDFVASNVNIDGKVDAVVEMMGKIVESISKISPAKLNKIASGMTNLASGIQTLTNVDTSKLSSIADSIDRMKDVRGFNNVRKALDGTAKSAKNLSDTKVSADFFSKSNADKTIARIDKAYESALNRFKNIGKDWKFDGSIESAREYEQELIRLKDRVRSVFETDIKGKGILDKTAIANVARSIQEINSRIVKTAQYINETQTASQRIAEAKIGVPFDAVAKKAEEASKQTKTLAETLTSAFRDNVNSGKDWIPPETIKDRCRALVEMRFQMEAIASELSKLSAQGDKADANRVQMLANAYQTLRNQISNIQLPTGGLEELDVRLRSILARTKENPLLNGKLNPNIDWTILTIGEEKVRSIGRATNEVTQGLSEISKFTMPRLSIGSRFTNEARELILNIQKAERAIESLKARYEKMQSLGKTGSLGANALRFDYEKTVAGYDKMLSKFRELQSTGRVFERVRNVMAGLDFEPVALKSGEKYTKGYAKLVSNIESARKSLERLGEVQEKMVHFGEDYGKAWDKNQYEIDRTRAKMSEYIARAHTMESAEDASVAAEKSSASLSAAKTAANKVVDALGKMYGAAKKVFTTTITLCARAVKGFVQLTAAITGGTIKAFMKLGSVIGTVAKKMADMTGITKMFSDSNIFGKIQKALKKIATLTVFMFLRTTIRNMMKLVREGLDNIVQVSERANAALSSFATNVTYLKNSFAAMITPILYVVYPALERLTNMLAHAANTVAAFFAAITGQRTFTRAIRVQEDYAASLNKTSTAAGKLHKQLAGFDDLNNLTTSQGKEDDLPSVQDMFEEVEVPDKIKNLADKIKEILKTDDWSEIGKMLAEKLNNAMAKIPWDRIEEEAQRIAKGIGTLINGFVDKLDWDLLGRTIARGINTALHFANTLLETINFEKIGQSLAKALKGLIDELDFDALGRFFANKFNWLIDIIHGFLKEMVDEWNNFGNRFGEAVDSFIRNLHLQEALESIALGLNGIADFVIGFVDNWIDEAYEWGKKIGDAVANMFSMIEWEKIGEALDKGFKFIIEVFWGFFDRMEGEWAKIGEGISQMIERAFNPETFAKAGTLIARAINAIIEVFQNLFKNKQMWENVGLSLGNFVNNIINGINWQGALNAVADFVNGFFIALDRFNSQVDWKKLADTLSSAINNLIHNVDWDAAAKTFGEFVLNLFNAIHDIVKQIDWEGIGKAIGTFLSNINWAQIIGDVFDIIWTVVSGLLKGLLSTDGGRVFVLLVALLGAIKLALKTIIPLGLIALFSAMSGSLTSGLGLLSSSFISTAGAKFGYAANVTAANYGAAATTAFGTTFAGLSAKVGTMSSGLGAALSAALSNPYVVAGIAIATFTATLIHNIDNCKKRFDQYGKGVSGWLHFFVEGLDSPLRALVDLFAPALSQNLDAFLDWKHELIENVFRGVETAAQDTFRILHGFIGEVKEWGNIVGEGLKNAAGGLKEFAGNVKDKIGEGLENAGNKIKEFAGGVKDKIKEGLDKAGDKIKEFADGAEGKIKDGLERAGTKAKEFGEGLKEKVGNGAKVAGDKIKEFADKVKSFFGGSDQQNEEYLDPFGNNKPMSASILDSFKKLGDTATTAFAAIGIGASNVGLSVSQSFAVIGTAASGIVTKLGEVGSNALENAKTIVSNVANGINGGIENVKTAIGNVASSISNKIGELANGAFEKGAEISEKVGNGIKSAVKFATTNAKKLVDDVSKAIGGGVKNALEKGKEIAHKVGDGIKATAKWSKDKATELTNNVITTFKDGIPKALEKGKEIAYKVGDGIRDISYWAKDKATELRENVIEMFHNAIPKALEKGKEIAYKVGDGIRDIAYWSKDKATELRENVIQMFSDGIPKALEKGKEISFKIGDGIRDVAYWSKDKATELRDNVIQMFSDGIPQALNKGKEIAYKVGDGIRDVAQWAIGRAQELTSNVISKFHDGISQALEKGKEIAYKVGDGIRDVAGWAKDQATALVNNVTSAFQGAVQTAFNWGKEIAYKVGDGIRDAAGWAKNQFGSLVSNLPSNVSSAISKAKEVGGSIVSGLANGISDAANTVKTAAGNIATKLTNSTKSKLKMRSPSRVFYEIGENVVAGLNNGIEKMASSTGNVVQNWVDRFATADATVSFKANVEDIKNLVPNIGSEIDLQRSMAMQNNVTIDGSEIKNLVHAIEMMTMQDQAAMRQQTEYLEQIARKEFSIGQRDVFNAVQSEASAYEMRTGQPAFGY